MASGALQKTETGETADTFAALILRDGSVGHPYARSAVLLSGPRATRNLSDLVHCLCVLHGRLPGVIDLAANHEGQEAAQGWLAAAARGFALERGYLVRLAAAAGPFPSTPGHAESEAAMSAQRHALEMLAQSDRVGCALGAAFALVLDWPAIREVLDIAADRFGAERIPADLPTEAETIAAARAVAGGPRVKRAVGFGARQLLAQHRSLWDLLEAREVARRQA